MSARPLSLFFGAVTVLLSGGCSSDQDDGISIANDAPLAPGSPLGGSAGVPIPTPGAGATGFGGAGNCSPAVVGRLRDFKDAHPDFQYVNQPHEKGIVLETLGPERKPVFSGGSFKTVHTAAEFDQWYRDVSGVNMAYDHAIAFTVGTDGRAVYDNSAFFPLDERGFGNEGREHNFHFTFELHMTFRYQGGEVFRFRGDDDLWVFVNDKLAIDLGGVHAALSDELNLDQEAARLGITVGGEYNLDFFHAERHTSQSNFRVETNLEFTNCEPIIIP